MDPESRRADPPRRGVRNAIVVAAAQLFASRGYRRTTLDEVATAAGIKKATLYHYISSKEELLTDIYGRILDRIEAAVLPLAKLDLAADERLRRMLHAHIQVVASERDLLAVAFREEAELPIALRSAIRDRKRAYQRVFQGLIDEGQAQGIFRQVDSELLTVALLGMSNWLYQWYRPHRHDPDAIAAVFTLLIEQGILSTGDQRLGAWPRYETVDAPLRDVGNALNTSRAAIELASRELENVHVRLLDGLAGTGSRRSTRRRSQSRGGR